MGPHGSNPMDIDTLSMQSQVTGSHASSWFPVNTARFAMVYIDWDASSSGGTVVVEWTESSNPSSTTFPNQSVAWTAGGHEDTVEITTAGANFIRTRTVSVVGGNGVSTNLARFN